MARRVLVVDDHEVVQWGLRLLLGSRPWVDRCLSARSGDEAVALARRYDPHVALVDLWIGEEWGTDICARLCEVSPAPRVILLSGMGRVSTAAARAAGAAGVLPKRASAEEVVRAVRAVASGATVFPAAEEAPPSALSAREREILGLIASGATNPEIGARLHLSPNTVKEHASSLFRKLAVRNRAEAVRRAQRIGLLA